MFHLIFENRRSSVLCVPSIVSYQLLWRADCVFFTSATFFCHCFQSKRLHEKWRIHCKSNREIDWKFEKFDLQSIRHLPVNNTNVSIIFLCDKINCKLSSWRSKWKYWKCSSAKWNRTVFRRPVFCYDEHVSFLLTNNDCHVFYVIIVLVRRALYSFEMRCLFHRYCWSPCKVFSISSSLSFVAK